eukprot:3484631-Rhodomonas_salina.1
MPPAMARKRRASVSSVRSWFQQDSEDGEAGHVTANNTSDLDRSSPVAKCAESAERTGAGHSAASLNGSKEPPWPGGEERGDCGDHGQKDAEILRVWLEKHMLESVQEVSESGSPVPGLTPFRQSLQRKATMNSMAGKTAAPALGVAHCVGSTDTDKGPSLRAVLG